MPLSQTFTSKDSADAAEWASSLQSKMSPSVSGTKKPNLGLHPVMDVFDDDYLAFRDY